MQTELYQPDTFSDTLPDAPIAEQVNDWDAFFAGAVALSEGEVVAQLGTTFDDLAARVAEGPSDEEAVAAVRSLLVEVKARGYVEQAMQMAMTLGAMACTHNHMQGLANEVGSMFDDAFSSHGKDDGHNHDRENDSHDAKTCADCKAGRACRKK